MGLFDFFKKSKGTTVSQKHRISFSIFQESSASMSAAEQKEETAGMPMRGISLRSERSGTRVTLLSTMDGKSTDIL